MAFNRLNAPNFFALGDDSTFVLMSSGEGITSEGTNYVEEAYPELQNLKKVRISEGAGGYRYYEPVGDQDDQKAEANNDGTCVVNVVTFDQYLREQGDKKLDTGFTVAQQLVINALDIYWENPRGDWRTSSAVLDRLERTQKLNLSFVESKATNGTPVHHALMRCGVGNAKDFPNKVVRQDYIRFVTGLLTRAARQGFDFGQADTIGNTCWHLAAFIFDQTSGSCPLSQLVSIYNANPVLKAKLKNEVYTKKNGEGYTPLVMSHFVRNTFYTSLLETALGLDKKKEPKEVKGAPEKREVKAPHARLHGSASNYELASVRKHQEEDMIELAKALGPFGVQPKQRRYSM